MSIFDIFRGLHYKQELESYKTSLPREALDIISLSRRLNEIQSQLSDLDKKYATKKFEFDQITEQVAEKKKQVIILDDELLYQEFNLYEPHYKFITSTEYKEALEGVREKQKILIKQELAIFCNSDWTVGNSRQKGQKMVRDTSKLLLRAFNSECDDCIEKVKFNNIDSILKRLEKSYSQINKLGVVLGIYISDQYFHLKIEELYLCHEMNIKIQEEKDEAKRIREERKEVERINRELEEARANTEKDRKHYLKALEDTQKQLAIAEGERKSLLEEKIKEIEYTIADIDAKLNDIDYRQNNQKAGYVYIISNIGSFGEGIYKIGMSRRLDPTERIDELGDASVPFKFDTHALIFSEDAPALETALHRAFEDKKLNFVNNRREFFYVDLADIEEVVKNNHDKTVEFIHTPVAEQYRMSLKIREKRQI